MRLTQFQGQLLFCAEYRQRIHTRKGSR